MFSQVGEDEVSHLAAKCLLFFSSGEGVQSTELLLLGSIIILKTHSVPSHSLLIRWRKLLQTHYSSSNFFLVDKGLQTLTWKVL